MTTNQKKHLAIMLAADDKYAFAMASVLLDLKQKSPKLLALADVFAYTQGLSVQNADALQKIVPLKIIDFKLPFNPSQIKTIARYSQLTMARYEAFGLLNQYKTVLWLDVDVLIQQELLPILNYCGTGFALAFDDNFVAANFFSKIGNYNLSEQNRNAGIMMVDDTLPSFEDIGRWCYQMTQTCAPSLNWIDQGIINIALQHFKINCTELPLNFNAQPITSYIKLMDTYIVHAMGPDKFWNAFTMPQWDKNYATWINLGGGTKVNIPFNKKVYCMFKIKLFLENHPILWAIFNWINKFRFKKYNNKELKKMNTTNL